MRYLPCLASISDRVGDFGVADLTSFVDVFAGEAEIGGGGRANVLLLQEVVLVWNDFRTACLLSNLAPLSRRIVFIGEPTLGRVNLGAMRCGNQGVVRALGFGETRRSPGGASAF